MKKQIIRILSVIIAVLVVVMTMPLGAFAATVPSINGYIILDEQQTVYYYGSAEYYSFCPEESGLYLISSDGDLDTFVTAYDRNMDKLDSDDDSGDNGNFALSLRLEKYNTYYFKLGAYGEGEFTFTVTMPETATDIAVCDSNGNTVESIYAHTNESTRYFTKLLPDGSAGDSVVWSIADTDIATVDSYGKVTFKAAGSTSLVAAAGDLSVTVPVTVANAIELVPEVENSISIPSIGDHLCIYFTAPESGDYSFTYSQLDGLNVSVYSQWGDEFYFGTDLSDSFTIGMNEASSIKIKVDYTECTAEAFSIKAERITYAESIDIYTTVNDVKLYCDYYNIYVGDTLQLGCETYPEDSVISGNLTYSGSDSTIAEVTSGGFITANKEGSITVTADSFACSDEITINVMEKEEIPLNETYNYDLTQEALGKYSGTFQLEEDSNLKISFTAGSSVIVAVYDEWGELITQAGGTEGIIRNWFSNSYGHYIVITSDDPSENITCSLTVEEYIPVDYLQIVDSEGNDCTEYYGEVGDSFQLGYNIYPEGAVTEVKWVSGNTDIAQVDEYGNVYFLNAGETYIYVYQLNDNGEIVDYTSDCIYVSAEKITDSYFGYSHYITIEDYTITEQLRVTAPHTGYFYLQTTGNDNHMGITAINTADGTEVERFDRYISETEYMYTFYLEEGEKYIFRFSGTYGAGYTVQLGSYSVPNEIYITDTLGNTVTEVSGYVNEGIPLDFEYDVYGCYREAYEWTSSDESVAVVDVGGYVSFLKKGTATLTLTTATGLTASVTVTVTEGKQITLDTPVTETLSNDGNSSVRFLFTPTATAVYEISALNTLGGNTYLNFAVLDSNYNQIMLIQNSDKFASFKMEADKTYMIKVYERGQGGTYSFTLKNKTVGLNTALSLSMAEGSYESINYYFIPEKTGYYLFKTSGYSDDGWGRGVNIYSTQGEILSDFSIDNNSSLSYAALTAGEVYRAEIFKNYWNAASFTFEITEAVGISSMEILTMPTDSTVIETTTDFNFSGLSLRVTTSDGNVQTWNYNDSTQYICGFSYSHTYSEEIDGVRYAYIKAGGAVCTVPFTVKSLEVLTVNNPVQVTYDAGYDTVYYKFIPEETGWYLFESYNHTVAADNGNMHIELNSMRITEAVGNDERLEMYAYLTKGEGYVIKMYKYFNASENFTLSVTDNAVAIENISIKQNPTNMTVSETLVSDPDLSGLVLTVTTTDGQTRDWSYTEGADNIFGYMLDMHWSQFQDTVDYYLYAGGNSVMLTYALVPYPLESIEVITPGDITIVENTNGHWMAEETYYYEVPSYKVKLKLNYTDGTYKFASIYEEVDGYRINYYDSQTEIPWVKDGDNYFTVTFADKTVRVPVKIVENNFQSIEVIDDGDLTATVDNAHYEPMGEDEGLWYYNIDYSDVKLKISFTDGTSKIASPGDKVRGIYLSTYSSQYMNPIEAGKDNYITVTYGDAGVDLPVTLLDSGIESVSLTKTPEDPYIYGDMAHGSGDGEEYWFYPDFSDGYEFTVKYKDGTEMTVSDADYDKDEFDLSYPDIGLYNTLASVGTNKAYFAWGGTVINFDIELVESDVASIEVLEKPTVPDDLEYYPDMVGLTLKITYTDGTSKTVALTESDISYRDTYEPVYITYIDGKMLTVKPSGEEYRINYKGKEAYFDIEKYSSFYTQNMNLVEFDKDNETVTVSYTYCKNSSQVVKTLTLDLSTAEKYIYDNGASYSNTYIGEDGIFVWSFSHNANTDSGLVSYYVSLLNGSDNGYLLDSAGDINGDGEIDLRDLVRLKKLIADDSTETVSPADFDGDGKHTATDMAYLRKCILGKARLSVIDGDANGDGYLDYTDALAIAMYLAGSGEILTSRADVNIDGVIDQTDIDLINSML